MKRKERQQKLHESLVNMLYAPPSSSPSPSPSPPSHQNQFDEQTLNFAREIINSDSHHINELEEDDDERSSEEGELGFQKLTRAQRKRLRKKKLKEAAAHRRQIIGPQLPPAITGSDQIDGEVGGIGDHEHPEGVRRNSAEKPQSGNDDNQK